MSRLDEFMKENDEETMKQDIQFVNRYIETTKLDTNQISDGFHNFGDLYKQRIELWIAFCKFYGSDHRYWAASDQPWRTLRHSDGELAFGGGWMVLGIGIAEGTQMTYHLPESYWDQCDFARTLDMAPKWDGHTSEEVLQRLKQL